MKNYYNNPNLFQNYIIYYHRLTVAFLNRKNPTLNLKYSNFKSFAHKDVNNFLIKKGVYSVHGMEKPYTVTRWVDLRSSNGHYFTDNSRVCPVSFRRFDKYKWRT